MFVAIKIIALAPHLFALLNKDKVLGSAARWKRATGVCLGAQVHVGDLGAVIALGGAVHPRTRVAEKARLWREADMMSGAWEAPNHHSANTTTCHRSSQTISNHLKTI